MSAKVIWDGYLKGSMRKFRIVRMDGNAVMEISDDKDALEVERWKAVPDEHKEEAFKTAIGAYSDLHRKTYPNLAD